MLEVERFYESLHSADGVQILNGKYKWKYYLHVICYITISWGLCKFYIVYL